MQVQKDSDNGGQGLARVVALAGLGEESLEAFGEELSSLAEELEAAFDTQAPGTAPDPGRGTVALSELREDEARERTHSWLWLDAAPARHGDWLDVPPVRGTGDEEPELVHLEAEPSTPWTSPPAPGHADVLPLLAEDATALAARRLQPADVFEAHMAPLDSLSDPLDPWRALIDAVAPTKQQLRSLPEGPLHGIPLVVKTNIATEGFETNCASRSLAGWRAPYTATCVRRLVAAGAVPFASANMDEFAMGSSGERSGLGATRNPWTPKDAAAALAPGGSSSGSAAAVAAGLATLALGSDAGGSIRQPAAFCGVSGLRPSAGRLSRFGLVAFSSSFDTIGPLARSARDLQAAFGAMAGSDPRDVTTTRESGLPLIASGWQGLTVGVPRKLLEECGLEPEVAASFQASLDELEGLGAQLVDIELGGPTGRPDAALSSYHVISCAEAASNLARVDGMRFGPALQRGPDANFKIARRELRESTFGPEVKRRLLIGTFSLARAGAPRLFERARAARDATALEFHRAFEHCALVAMPTSPTRAFALGARLADPMAMYRADLLTVPASLAGVAALSIPGPLLSSATPIGFQLIAPRLGDERLLDLAARYQLKHPHHLVRPGGHS